MDHRPAVSTTHTPSEQSRRSLRSRLGEWTRRYLPLEIIATMTAVAGGVLTALFTANPVAIAFGGTWGENAGYYSYAYAREMRAISAQCAAEGCRAPGFLARSYDVIKRLIWEFGLAELADSFVVRPFCMFTASSLLGSLELGIIAGKLAADVIFYAIAVVFYELSKAKRQKARS